MKRINAMVVSTTFICGLAGSAPASADDAVTELATPTYCVELGPLVVEGKTVYPGGRYCVPGP